MSSPKPYILVAEDSATQAKILERSLAEEDFEIEIFENGQLAWEQLSVRIPAIIISDVEMPVLNGYEFCRKVKADEKLAAIPFILVTTLNDPKSLLKGIEAGANNYITKPYSKETLLERIRQYLVVDPQQMAVPNSDTEIRIQGQTYQITADKSHILQFLLSTYENILHQNEELQRVRNALNKTNRHLQNSRQEIEKVLRNVFPETVAGHLISKGDYEPIRFENATVVFTDFVNFARSAEKMQAAELVKDLEWYFTQFDAVLEKRSLEKIKTIGDSYMFAGGVPNPTPTHAVDCTLAAMEIMQIVQRKLASGRGWDLRIGINTGSVVGGIIGKKRFAFDIWGPTVNYTSRLERGSNPGAINISEGTYQQIKGFFYCQSRGVIETKDGQLPMYFVKGLHTHLQSDDNPQEPNQAFWNKYNLLARLQER